MKKFLLLLFILLDGLLIAGSGFFLFVYLKKDVQIPWLKNIAIPGIKLPMPRAATTAPTYPNAMQTAPTAISTMTPVTPMMAGTPGSAATRKIGFAYRNSKAKKVMIRADFTGWRAERMEKDANNVWHYMAVLEPGEYAYCFSVDDKSIKDPANKRTKQVGKTIVSSIVVAPPTAAPR